MPRHVKPNGDLRNMKRLAWPRQEGGYTALVNEAIGLGKELFTTLREELKNMTFTASLIYKSIKFSIFPVSKDESEVWWYEDKATGETCVKDARKQYINFY